MEKKNMFDRNPEAQAIQMLIHDTNSGFANIRGAVRIIRDKLKILSIEDEEIEKELEYIKNSSKITKTIDNYYEKWQNNFE